MNRFTLAGIPGFAAAVLAAIPADASCVEAQAARSDMTKARDNPSAWLADLNDEPAAWWALSTACDATSWFSGNGFIDAEALIEFETLQMLEEGVPDIIGQRLDELEQAGVPSELRIEHTDEHTWVAALLQPGARDAHVDAWGDSAAEAVQKLAAECRDWNPDEEELKDIR